MKVLSTRVHGETGFLIFEYQEDDGTTCEMIETNDGEEIELGEFEKKIARRL